MKHFENLTKDEELLSKEFFDEAQAYFDVISAVHTYKDFFELFCKLCAERNVSIIERRYR